MIDERFTIKRKNSNWVHKTYYVICDGKEEILGLTNKKEAHDVCQYMNYMANRHRETLQELYCKDRVLEANGIDIECCD